MNFLKKNWAWITTFVTFFVLVGSLAIHSYYQPLEYDEYLAKSQKLDAEYSKLFRESTLIREQIRDPTIVEKLMSMTPEEAAAWRKEAKIWLAKRKALRKKKERLQRKKTGRPNDHTLPLIRNPQSTGTNLVDGFRRQFPLCSCQRHRSARLKIDKTSRKRLKLLNVKNSLAVIRITDIIVILNRQDLRSWTPKDPR